MKDIQLSPALSKKIIEIRSHNKLLYKKIQKQLRLFQLNPRHKSLRTHKLKGSLQNVWSISIDMNYRMLYKEDKKIYFFSLGTHTDVYRNN